MKIFTALIAFLAVLVAGTAAYFSVFGLATLFSGALISVVVMASVLEAAKLGATSYLYRYWEKTNKWLRSFMVFCIIGLMIITSWGIYGYLSNAYTTSRSGFESYTRQLEIKELGKSFKEKEVEMIVKRMDSLSGARSQQEQRLSDGPLASEKRSTLELRLWNQQQIDLINDTTEDLNELQITLNEASERLLVEELKIAEFKGTFSSQTDIISFQFVADALGVDLDTAVTWLIVLIIIVFDPVAISLILAYNTIVMKGEDEIVVDKSDKDIIDIVDDEPPEEKKKVPVNTVKDGLGNTTEESFH